VLKVPHSYVGALQLDPIEKKPFFHALPGAKALSFGMLGCDYHCGYCFTGDTTIITGDGPLTFQELFESCPRIDQVPGGELADPGGRSTVSGSGRERRMRAVVRHRYAGTLVVLRPLYLPAVRCTPDHRLFATRDPATPPSLTAAKDLSRQHYLAVPHPAEAGEIGPIDTAAALQGHQATRRVSRTIPAETRELILMASARGESSRAIGQAIGMDASHVRHIRSKAARGLDAPTRTIGVVAADDFTRFSGEHRPGIPRRVALDTDLAALLGYYCAEGCVTKSPKRPNSFILNFSFALTEEFLVRRVQALLARCLAVQAGVVRRETTLALTAGKTSAAVLFKALAGSRSTEKRVPMSIARAPRKIVHAFLDAYVEGDGHRYPNGKVGITTVSRRMAHGVAWLALRCGWLPSIYASEVCGDGVIQGRPVKRAPNQYTVVWYPNASVRRRVVETDSCHLVPLRSVETEPFDGYVYNMEVEQEHSYLANFFAVSNCQNWLTSQALRDPDVDAPPQEMSAEGLVRLARKHGARVMTSTYNEPLITSEWAVDVFREARAAGLVCSYVSNGNGTPEVLDYIRPWVSLYKVDLKSFRDRHYRELGGTLERVLWTIRALHDMGFWVEVVTLTIPGFNDSGEELADIARFLVSVSPDIPWHVTAFHQDYKMRDRGNTPLATLLRAAEIGAREGLRYVYAGNIPGAVGRWENTYCPHCAALLIERVGYRILKNRLDAGSCPECARPIAGFWEPQAARLDRTGDTRAVECWPEKQRPAGAQRPGGPPA
jgi:pyruvate formate lyase activating enzyme